MLSMSLASAPEEPLELKHVRHVRVNDTLDKLRQQGARNNEATVFSVRKNLLAHAQLVAGYRRYIHAAV
jgi:hypothetical protein